MANQYQRDVFRDKLLAARTDAGLTQRELARRIGVSHGTISQWEAATAAPREDVVARLEQALGLPADTFAGILGYIPYGVQMQAVATVAEAIDHDPRLDARDRQILTAMYRELVRAHTTALDGLPTTHDEPQAPAGRAAAANLLSDRPVTLPAPPRPPSRHAGQSPAPAARRRSTN